jgi:hypothetical protein
MTMTCLQNGTKAVAPSTPGFSGLALQRKCACGGAAGAMDQCHGCNNNKLSLQRSTENSEHETRSTDGVPPVVNEVLRVPGQPLDRETRAFMEPRFGHDFSQLPVHGNVLENSDSNLTLSQPGDRYEQEADDVAKRVMLQSPQAAKAEPANSFDFGNVRIHTDVRAAESARAVNARAYTVGNHIVFGAGQYSPNNPAGQSLLAHEWAHVAQSTAGRFVLRTPEGPLPQPVVAAPTELAAPPIPTATIILVGSPTDSTSGVFDVSPYNFSDAAVKAVPKIVADLPGTQATILYFSPGYKQRGNSVHKKALADLQGSGASVVEVTTDAQVISFLNTGLVTPIENTPTRAVKISRFFYFGHGGKSGLLLNWGWGGLLPTVAISTPEITDVKTEAFVPAGQSYLFTCHVAEGDKSFASVWASHVGQTAIGPQGVAAFNAKYSAASLEKAINAQLPKWFLGLPYMNQVRIVDPAPVAPAVEAPK